MLKQGDLPQHSWGGKLLFVWGLFCLDVTFSLFGGQVMHTKMSGLVNFWRQVQKKDTSDCEDKTYQIPSNLCLYQNERRDSLELHLLSVENTSVETEFYFNCSCLQDVEINTRVVAIILLFTFRFWNRAETSFLWQAEDLGSGPSTGS